VRHFEWDRVREAVRWAAAGGQALHTHPFIPCGAPRPFALAAARGQGAGHLFDWDAGRLTHAARRLGVRIRLVEHADTARQHVDLCGRPLRDAAGACGLPGVSARVFLTRRGVPVPYPDALLEFPGVGIGRGVGVDDWGVWNRSHPRWLAAGPDWPAAVALDTEWRWPEPVWRKLLSLAASPPPDWAGYARPVTVGGVTVGLLFRVRTDLEQAVSSAAVGDGERLAVLGGPPDYSEAGVAERFAAMTPEAFAAAVRRRWRREPTPVEVRQAFGRGAADASG